MVDEPTPSWPNGELAGQIGQSRCCSRGPAGCSRRYTASVRAGVVDAIEPMRAVRAEHLHGAAEGRRLVTIRAKRGGTIGASGPLGSIDRNEPSFAPVAGSGAEVRQAADQESVRVQHRAGFDIRRNLVGIGFAQAPPGSALRNVPICAIADAPGIFMATTWASRPGILCVRSSGHAISPPRPAIPAATAIMPRAVCLLVCPIDSAGGLPDHSFRRNQFPLGHGGRRRFDWKRSQRRAPWKSDCWYRRLLHAPARGQAAAPATRPMKFRRFN